jgi:hypothetical protein
MVWVPRVHATMNERLVLIARFGHAAFLERANSAVHYHADAHKHEQTHLLPVKNELQREKRNTRANHHK